MNRLSRSLLLLCAASVFCGAALVPGNLRCEYRADPLGVDTPQPRLSWTLQSADRSEAQTAWQVLVATAPDKLKPDSADLWDSGKSVSSEMNQIAYGGAKLASSRTVYWTVRVWDKGGKPSPWSQPAQWYTGILNESDWKARWITRPVNPEGSGPLPLFRKEFRAAGAVKRAVAHVSGLGFFEFHVNGRKAGDDVLSPGWTNYRKTVFYVSHDVTSLLRPGANVLGVMLGNGMYNVPGGRYVKFKGSFGKPKLLVQLHLEYSDGRTEIIASDETWRAAEGPIRFSCIYGGEDYDARFEQPGWDAPGFDDSNWERAVITEGPGGRLAAQSHPPSKIMQRFETLRVAEPAPGVKVYDLGQNFAGWPEIAARGPKGATVKLTPGELVDARGFVDQRSSLGSAKQPMYFSYTLKGEGLEIWRPRFSYWGFRYLQVETAGAELATVRGHFVHSSAERVGEFSCSNDLFNRIHKLIDAAVRSNMQSVLTDCPHREKLGWLEVAHLLGPSIAYNYDIATLYSKIVDDAGEAQTAEGLVPDIAPEYTVFKEGFRDSPEWGSAFIIVPRMLHQWYGERRATEKHYPAMTRYTDYLVSKSNGLIVSHGLGDWYDIGPGRPGPSKLTPKGVTATAILYQDLLALERAANLLGRKDRASQHAVQAAKVREAFLAAFLDRATGRIASGSQTSQAMPLVAGLVPSQLRNQVLELLVSDVRARGNQQTSGDVGYTYLVKALAEGGRSNVLFDMTNRTGPPSYGAQLQNGATALTEAWDADPLSSHNHCMLGHIEEWFYAWLAGIQPDPDGPGFRKVIIAPQVVGDLTWVKGSYRSVRGLIRSEWRLEGRAVRLKISIPPGVEATVYVPGKPGLERRIVGSGEWEFAAAREL